MDAGGQSTRAVAVAENGMLAGRGTGGAAALFERIPSQAAAEIARAAAQAAGSNTADIVVAGVSGASDPQAAAGLRQVLGESAIARTLHLLPDAVIALEGAFPGRAGIVVIAGTGSVAWGRNDTGEEARAGGWGYLLDAGSAVDIGRKVMTVLRREREKGVDRGMALWKAAVLRLGAGGVDDLVAAAGTLRLTDLAVLAPAALDAAADGDRTARRIIQDAAADLAAAAAIVWNRLGFAAPSPVAGVGGLFSHPIMRETFREAVRQTIPDAEVTSPSLPPVGGAIWKAFSFLGLPVNEERMTAIRLAVTADAGPL